VDRDGSLGLALRLALVGLAVHVALVFVLLVGADWRPEWFVHLGSERIPVQLARSVLGNDVLVPHLDGHDGRFFWVLARDPLLLDGKTVVAPNLDRPAYRAQRILYPALAAPWRMFGEHALLWGLVVTNLAVVYAGGLIAALLARSLRAPPRAALAFALSPGVFVATIMDGSDALALGGLLAALLALVHGRTRWAIVAGVVAVLAKEPTLAGIAGAAIAVRTITRRERIAVVAVPALTGVAWGVYARWRLGWPPSGVEEFAAPLWGYVDAYRRGWSVERNWSDAVIAVALVPLALVIVRRWWRRGGVLLWTAMPFVTMIPFFSAQVLDLAVNTLRAAGPAITLLWLDAYAPATPRATSNTDRPPTEVLRAIRRWRSRSRPLPAVPRG
jgi:hypothetical protein